MCGLRELQSKEVAHESKLFKRITLSDLEEEQDEVIRYTEEQREDLEELMKKEIFRVPANENGELVEVRLWEARSYYQHRVDDEIVIYHLHRELVDEDANGNVGTWLCPTCHKCLMKGKTPPLSIAAGVDFGNFRRIPGIIEPNLHEQIILAQMRLFQAIIKVMPNHGYQQNFTRWNIKGNAILFSHDAPMTVGKKIMGSGRYLKETMVTYLLDEDGKVDRLAAKLLKTTSILARTHVVKQWLTLLSHVNTWYKDFDEASIE